MEIKDLRYFVEIAELKSMRKAAASLYISQPNLTRAVKSLESELGEQIFKRSNRGVELTEFGEGLYYYAQSILKQVNEIAKLRQETKKYVEARVSAAIGGIILRDDMMLQYYETIKANHTSISLFEIPVEKVLNYVETGKADIGIVSVNNVQIRALRKLSELKDLDLHTIGYGPLYVHVGKNNPLYGREEIEVRELLPFTKIQMPADYFANINYSMSIDGSVGMMDFDKTITVNNYHAIISMVKRTDAFIFGNKWQKEELEKGQICSIRLKNCSIERELLWLKRRRETLSDKAEDFLKLIVDCYGDKNGDT